MKTKKVKAWVVLNEDDLIELPTIGDKKHANNFCYKWDGDILIPCTITFQLKKRKL